jgi:hypothetical protein
MRRARKSEKAKPPPPEELDRITADLDREFVADTFRPLTDEEAKTWRKAKRKRGRPVRGRGSKVISVSIERRLLDRTDRLARKKRVSRAQLIARGLHAVLAAEADTRS